MLDNVCYVKLDLKRPIWSGPPGVRRHQNETDADTEMKRLAVGEPELAAEVPGRHVRAAGERLDIQHAERYVDIDVLQVVGAGAAHLQHS